MADCETGEPRTDSETGEERCASVAFTSLARGRAARGVLVTVETDAETGESEWQSTGDDLHQHLNTEDSPHHHPRTSSFHIPRTLLLQNTPPTGPSYLPPVICLLPVLVFCPALTVALFMLTEVCMHVWYHRKVRGHLPRHYQQQDYYNLSPLHKLVSAYCGSCQADKFFLEELKTRRKKLLAIHLKNTCCHAKREPQAAC